MSGSKIGSLRGRKCVAPISLVAMVACWSTGPAALAAEKVPTAKGDIEIVPVEHASIVLRWGGKAIHVDPVGGAERYKALPAPDLILITHGHGDHMDAATLKAIAGEKTTLVMPKAVADALGKAEPALARLPQKVLANGEKTKVGEIGIEAVPMYNLAADRKKFHQKGAGNGYVLDLAGTRIYISGDTEDIPEMRRLKAIDAAFLCMNLPYTMTPEQLAGAVLEFKPKVVYPYHSRGQDPKKLKSLVEEKSKEIEVRLLDWYPKKSPQQ